jgi:pimeloyl-ACP methyl ester carboxylesterase
MELSCKGIKESGRRPLSESMISSRTQGPRRSQVSAVGKGLPRRTRRRREWRPALLPAARHRPRTLVIIHGGPGFSSAYFGHDLDALIGTGRGHALLFYDQRGAGQSTLVEDSVGLSAPWFAEDLEAVRRHFKFEKWKHGDTGRGTPPAPGLSALPARGGPLPGA